MYIGPSPEIQKILRQNTKDRQIEVNASKMELDSSALQVAYYLYE